jgi:predicted nuclease with TOPRIM domain
MREQIQAQIQARLEELKKELETGQAELQKVEAQRAYLNETMLRISGAIQALEELLAEEQPAEHDRAVSHQERHATDQAGEANAQQIENSASEKGMEP